MKKNIKIVEGDGVGYRLDKYLAGWLADVSRSKLQALIKSGKVLVNEKKAKASYSLSVGDDIVVVLPEEEEFILEAEDIDVEIVKETKDYFVVDKPAGMVVHPTDAGHHRSGTLVHALLSKGLNAVDLDDNLRPGIVHRLDKDTSGLLIVAKTKEVKDFFVEQFKERKVKKHYLALVGGHLEYAEGIIDSPIARDIKNRKKMGIVDSGKEAVSIYKVIDEYECENEKTVSYLDVEIKTGRTHQIRVHMTAIGYPVVCDNTYGNRALNKYFKTDLGLKRQFLHAHTLEFEDPSTAETVKVISKLPSDLDSILKGLKKL